MRIRSRVAAGLLCVAGWAAGCGSGEAESSPGGLAELLAAVCPEGPVAATRLERALPDEAALLAARVAQATGEDFEDWMHTRRPFDPAYGLSAAEFDALRRAWGSEERVMLTLDEHVIEFVHKPTLSRIIAGVELATLNDVELHAEADRIRTYWGDLQPGEAWAPQYPEDHPFHGFTGRRWSLQEGNWELARRDPNGTAKEVRFELLRSPEGDRAGIVFRVASRRSGVTYVDDEIILRYAVDPAGTDGR